MNELIKKIERWSIDRDLHNANPMKQYDKLVEEHGELVKGLNKQDEKLIKDSIGDMFVVITIMAQQINGDMQEVMEHKDIDVFEDADTLRFTMLLAYVGVNLKEGNIRLKAIGAKSWASNTDDYQIRKNLTETEKILGALVNLLDKTAKAHGTDLKTCVQLAYDEIKDRKGEMRDGRFVKQEDL
ncbi:MazG-like family protein [Staphylococcus americanisciuri]|uniref:MazG-like family protein n=1 Tax=Staphylococcus americanisciuri TaxID=2973940 RepID=A0ABT2F498_9STAP|nr:MazG-like family protein [Staphylococcus americanisciuri]MCS4487205.1 MazG-like family protein [Staphylococcus americanisciuri]